MGPYGEVEERYDQAPRPQIIEQLEGRAVATMEGTRPRGNSGVGTVARFAKRLEADPLGRKDSNSKRKEQSEE